MRGEHGIRLLAQAVEADSVEALEDIPTLAVLGRAAMLRREAQDVFEAGDHPLLDG